MDILLVFACFYFAYVNGAALLKVPFSQWELVHWVMTVVVLLLAALGGWKSWHLYKTWRYKKDHPEEFEEKLAPPAEPQRPAAPPPPAGQDYDDDYKAWADADDEDEEGLEDDGIGGDDDTCNTKETL